jgi:hypothetical protein
MAPARYDVRTRCRASNPTACCPRKDDPAQCKNSANFILYQILDNVKILENFVIFGVADPGCLSRIPDPEFFTHPGSRIQKPQQKRRMKKKISFHTFFCSHKLHKIENYFIFEMLKEKIWPCFQIITEFTAQKLSLCSKKYGFGCWDPEKTHSRSRIRVQGSKRHRIPDRSGSTTLVILKVAMT